MVAKLPVSSPRSARAEFRVFSAASGWMPASRNCRRRRLVRADSRRALSPLPLPSESRRQSWPWAAKLSRLSPQTFSPYLGRRTAPTRHSGPPPPETGFSAVRSTAAAESSSPIWAYWPRASRRLSSSRRRYCRRRR